MSGPMKSLPEFPFESVLIANRGAIARRIARTCRELGLKPIMLAPEDDGHPELLLLAEEVIEAPAGCYLDAQQLARWAAERKAALHPGYGFLSENPVLAEACAEQGVTWIGPSVAALKICGDKGRCAEKMKAAGLPLLPSLRCSAWSDDLPQQLQNQGLNFPLMLKPAQGGGGIGMQWVEQKEDLQSALEQSLALAQRHFGGGEILIERALPAVRHIEVQVLADAQGEVQTLFERECSLQRRRQKVIEEGPSPALNQAQRERLYALARQAAIAVGLDQVGTVEFLWDGDHFWFLEINPRLQVEHAVTEALTGVDLVACQLYLAAGAELEALQLPHSFQGHAFEVRLYAEDPWSGLPAPGYIEALTLPDGMGLRLELGAYAGMQVSTQYDPLLLKLIAQGPDRESARRRLVLALQCLEIRGDAVLCTNQASLLAALQNASVVAGDYHTRSFEAFTPPQPPDSLQSLQDLLTPLSEWQRRPQAQQTQGQSFGSTRLMHGWRPRHWV